jgi:fatty acid desaturase
LNINLNYHIEHHLFPGVPWYNLPKVHALLLEDYKAAGSSIYGSYTHFLFDAFRTGIHGLAPRKASAQLAEQRPPQLAAAAPAPHEPRPVRVESASVR